MNKDQLNLFPGYEGKDFRKIPLTKKMYQSIEEFYNWFNENIDRLNPKELLCIARDMQVIVSELEEMYLRQQRKAGELLRDKYK